MIVVLHGHILERNISRAISRSKSILHVSLKRLEPRNKMPSAESKGQGKNGGEGKTPRVLSLLSASTEIVCRLGMAHALVGRSHGCDAPPFVLSLPAVTTPKMDPTAPSQEIDAAVRAVVAGGGPVYEIHNSMVSALAPDIILTQDQCRICAVTKADVTSACAELPGVTIVTIQPTTLGDVLGDVRTIASALGVAVRAYKYL